MPKETLEQQISYNEKIIHKMLLITASPANENRDMKIHMMRDLYSKYIDGISDVGRLIGQVIAFQQKYNPYPKIMIHNEEDTFGPREVVMSDGTIKRKWGGRKRGKKTHKKKSKRRRSYSRNK